jgi:hypothetical protein
MATSGTYNFNPAFGEAGLYAFHLCGIRPPQVTQEHMFTLRIAANVLQLDWANEGVNLWEVELATPITFTAGTPTYSIPGNTIMMLDTYVTQLAIVAGQPNNDRILTPITRTEYASYPNKLQQGVPSVYWYDRLISPTVTLWPTPDAILYTQFNYYRVKQIQDAVLPGGTTLDVVQRFIPAYIDALAAELSRTWAPSRTQELMTTAAAKLGRAKGQDVERGNIYVSPMLSGYYRN